MAVSRSRLASPRAGIDRASSDVREIAFMNTLSFGFPIFTTRGVFCDGTAHRSRNIVKPPANETIMDFPSLHYLFVVPIGLAVAFMLWVLWSVTRQLAQAGAQPEKQQPMISVRVRDRFIDEPTRPMRNVQVSPSVRSPGSQAARTYSAPREFSNVPPAPILGMGFRSASSSRGQSLRR